MVLELKNGTGRFHSPRKRQRWKAILAIVVVLAGVAAVACAAAEPTPTPTGTPEPVDPKEELQRTVDRLVALQSVTFDLHHLIGSTSILPGVLMNRAYGKAIVPGRFAVTVEGELLFPRSYLQIEMISIDDTAFMTNLINGQWEQVTPESLPINLNNLGVVLADIVDEVQEPRLLGRDELNGVDVYRIGGEITSEVLKELVPTAGTGFPVSLEMWIEQDTGMLRQALITGQVVLTDVEDSQRELTLDDVDKPATIEPPGL